MALFTRELKVGVALGGGGVRGLVHLPLLEVLDDLGITPHAISGTSMGAIIGTLYAAGAPAKSIRSELMNYVVGPKDTVKTVFERRRELVKWFDLFTLQLGKGGVVRADGLLSFLFNEVKVKTFEELKIPLTIVASDYWTGEEVHFSSGELIPPVQASMSVPSVFSPVEINNRILVDGGVSNQLPYDLLTEECDIVIAIDVSGVRIPEGGRVFPKSMDAALVAFDISQEALVREKMKWNRPDIYIRPGIRNVGILEFDKWDEVLEIGDHCAAQFKIQVQEEVANHHSSIRSLLDTKLFTDQKKSNK